MGVGSPDRSAQEPDPAYHRITPDFIIGAPVFDNLVSSGSEQIALELKDDVLSTLLLVPVVNEKNFHDAGDPTAKVCTARSELPGSVILSPGRKFVRFANLRPGGDHLLPGIGKRIPEPG